MRICCAPHFTFAFSSFLSSYFCFCWAGNTGALTLSAAKTNVWTAAAAAANHGMTDERGSSRRSRWWSQAQLAASWKVERVTHTGSALSSCCWSVSDLCVPSARLQQKVNQVLCRAECEEGTLGALGVGSKVPVCQGITYLNWRRTTLPKKG